MLKRQCHEKIPAFWSRPVNSLKLPRNDTQLYISFNPNDERYEAFAVSAIEDWIRAIVSWMTRVKAEAVLIGKRQQLAKVRLSHIQVGNVEVFPITCVGKQGVWLDSNLEMNFHTSKFTDIFHRNWKHFCIEK